MRQGVKALGLGYVAEVLARLRARGEDPAPLAQLLPEPLSRRELEILGLLAQSLSNGEIATQLFISPGTVKRHAHNIYGKMAVSGRREAVAKATALGILAKGGR